MGHKSISTWVKVPHISFKILLLHLTMKYVLRMFGKETIMKVTAGLELI